MAKNFIHSSQNAKMLFEYEENSLDEVKEVNGVRVCCSEEFRIGKGDDGTRVYVGLGKDGYERAVKRLPRDACASTAEHEMRMLNTIQSNNVVRYWFFDAQSDRDYVYLILDLCEETLASFVAQKTVEHLTANAPEIIRQVLKGLADLHQNPTPILHRDLKPSNILRNVDGKWLLADFGISRVLTEGARTLKTKQSGTLGWKAVESCTEEGEIADVKVRYKKESDIQVRFIDDCILYSIGRNLLKYVRNATIESVSETYS